MGTLITEGLQMYKLNIKNILIENITLYQTANQTVISYENLEKSLSS